MHLTFPVTRSEFFQSLGGYIDLISQSVNEAYQFRAVP